MFRIRYLRWCVSTLTGQYWHGQREVTKRNPPRVRAGRASGAPFAAARRMRRKRGCSPCGAHEAQAAAQLAGPARRHSRRAFASARRMRRKRAAAHPCARTCSLSPASRSAPRRSTGDPIFLRPGFLPGLRGERLVRCARPGSRAERRQRSKLRSAGLWLRFCTPPASPAARTPSKPRQEAPSPPRRAHSPRKSSPRNPPDQGAPLAWAGAPTSTSPLRPI